MLMHCDYCERDVLPTVAHVAIIHSNDIDPPEQTDVCPDCGREIEESDND